MKPIFLFLFCIIFVQISAQTGKLYKGTINGNIKITLYLEGLQKGINADQIFGSYKYDNEKSYILLNGYRNNDGNISLTELSTPNFTGTFLGTLVENEIVGKWISADLKRNLPFNLTEIVPAKDQLNEFQKAIRDISNDFRNY